MKVLVIHCSYKFKGGEDTVVEEEIKLLQSQGIHTQLLHFDNDKKALAKLLQLPFNISSYFKTLKAVETFQPDVVHIHNWHFASSPSIIYALKKARVPFVTTLHNYRLVCPSGTLFYNGQVYLDSIQQSFPWNAISKGVYRNSKMLTFWISLSNYLHTKLGTWKICNRFIVLTPHAQNIFNHSKLKIPNKQMIVKPNFSSVPELRKSTTSNHFLYVGRLSEEKGITALLEAFAHSGLQLRIAGDGLMVNEVKSYCAKYPNITLLGQLTKEEVFKELNQCSAFVFPSVWYEGMPLTIIEAFALGVPVIASKLGAMEDMITHGFNGLLFEAGNVESMQAALHEWNDMPNSEKNEYRINAELTYSELYTPDKNAEQLLLIYKSVLNVEETVA